MIHFFYDADSEMSLAVAKEFGIDDPKYFIKMPYTISGELKYCDLITPELSTSFFKKVRAGEMPSTSALNAEEYKEIFEPAFREGGDILYVSFSSAMSATFNHMNIAVKELKEKYPTVTFTRIDSKAISMGTGLAVIAAAKMLKAGKSVDEIATFDILSLTSPSFLRSTLSTSLMRARFSICQDFIQPSKRLCRPLILSRRRLFSKH